MDVAVAALLVLVAYLLGSLSGSLLIGKLRHIDIRTLGSGNAGGTNALRTQGWRFALGTVLVDVGKGALATWLAMRYLPPGVQPWGTYVCALVAVTGHVWPIYHGFRGGKGAATVVGALLVAWPAVLPWVLGVWVVSLLASGYVGLSSVLAALSATLVALLAHAGSVRLAFAMVVGLLIVFTHRANLRRLRAGTESRFERVHVLGRLFTRGRHGSG